MTRVLVGVGFARVVAAVGNESGADGEVMTGSLNQPYSAISQGNARPKSNISQGTARPPRAPPTFKALSEGKPLRRMNTISPPSTPAMGKKGIMNKVAGNAIKMAISKPSSSSKMVKKIRSPISSNPATKPDIASDKTDIIFSVSAEIISNFMRSFTTWFR